MDFPLRFHASVIRGSGRGKDLGAPTINVSMSDVPKELEHGIYACWVVGAWHAKPLPAAMHYGPRPVFKDIDSCEVHLLNTVIEEAPASIEIDVVAYLRPVQDFESPALLMQQIADDIARAHTILSSNNML